MAIYTNDKVELTSTPNDPSGRLQITQTLTLQRTNRQEETRVRIFGRPGQVCMEGQRVYMSVKQRRFSENSCVYFNVEQAEKFVAHMQRCIAEAKGEKQS